MPDETTTIVVEPDGDRRFLRARLSGAWSREVDQRFVATIIEAFDATGLRALLIDHRELVHSASWSEIFFRAEDVAPDAELFTKVAFLYRDPAPDLPDRYAFLVSALRNRGIVSEAFDDDENAAIEWLSE